MRRGVLLPSGLKSLFIIGPHNAARRPVRGRPASEVKVEPPIVMLQLPLAQVNGMTGSFIKSPLNEISAPRSSAISSPGTTLSRTVPELVVLVE